MDRDSEQKQAKDLYYVYFVLRYAPNVETILEEIREYRSNGYFGEVPENLKRYFERKSSQGCLMIEKENGPDEYINDLREDIFERFERLQKTLA